MTDNYLTDPRHWTFEGEIAALHIFAKSHPKGLQGHFDIIHRHDVDYGPSEPAPVPLRNDGGEWEWPPETNEDAQTLQGLGWRWDNYNGCWAKF